MLFVVMTSYAPHCVNITKFISLFNISLIQLWQFVVCRFVLAGLENSQIVENVIGFITVSIRAERCVKCCKRQNAI